MKSILTAFIFCITFSIGYSQFGIGLTASNDLYHYYQNPDDNTAESTSAGSALLNFGLGPKIWMGGNDFSISLEAQATIGFFGLSVADYKGLGTTSFPIMAKFNFGGLSALDKEGKFGWSMGAGVQYSKTELYYLGNSFEEKGGERDLFRTYVGQLGYGFGMSGFTLHGFLRFGYHPDSGARSFNVGIQYDFNIPKLRNITDPESEL
ncbi:MAG: hypothetical protein P1U56_11055 [Saprospiraceae bacterium]|nr:hypothetical protein [Saprospiraceae bacterium]